MNALFISDLHLSEKRPHTTAAFFAFLAANVGCCEHLYILGDFFDAWIGDDDDRELAVEIAHAVKKFAESGTQVFFQHGNRDFLLGEDYAARCDMALLPELHIIERAGLRYLLAHGDQFCTQDVAYQQFRAQVRNEGWQREFLAKPLAERRAIATQLRASSMEANSNKAEDIMDVVPAEIVRVMDSHHCNVLIHGHTHRPACHQHQLPDSCVAERIVLGDWDSTYWYARLDDNGIWLLEESCIQHIV